MIGKLVHSGKPKYKVDFFVIIELEQEELVNELNV